ncbi:unnamed protein product [Durusdinium trenchii]|uniref:Uncharacterized protein n=1 Tax=Durusdinium trenchii TaxID=1381693 RepID=A0ABP0MXF0_9DINO
MRRPVSCFGRPPPLEAGAAGAPSVRLDSHLAAAVDQAAAWVAGRLEAIFAPWPRVVWHAHRPSRPA